MPCVLDEPPQAGQDRFLVPARQPGAPHLRFGDLQPLARKTALNLVVVLAAGSLTADCGVGGPTPSAEAGTLAGRVGDLSYVGQQRLEGAMDPSMLTLARRLDPEPRKDLSGRTPAWAVLNVASPPQLDFGVMTAQKAEQLNRFMPAIGEPPTPAAPFYLRTLGPERDRAILCLTQAIYYEAALEPTEGQEAVAQTVINRMRHPAFPKSICGVVYQGSQQVTGCQFSFTCDGSRDRAPEAEYWKRAKAVAEQAVSGFVLKSVGTSTSYHADYVFPRWGPTLVKLGQIGAHIFYRFPGPEGRPSSFSARYGGRELLVSMQGPSPAMILAAKAAGDAGQAGAADAIDPTASHAPHPSPGMVVGGRRVPTKEQIARINAALAAYEAGDKSANAGAAPLITPPSPPPSPPKGGRGAGSQSNPVTIEPPKARD